MPSAPADLFAAGLAALERGDLAAAEAALRDRVSREPVDHRAWNALAWTYLQSGRSELALQAAEQAHRANRNNIDYLNTLGVAYGETGALDDAAGTFRKALKRNPVFLDALINLAKTLEKQEQVDEAIRLYERALALAEKHAQLPANLARLYCMRGDAAHARQVLERSRSHIEPQQLAIALAQCDYEEAGGDAAIERLSAACAAHPDWPLARHALAHALLANGNWRAGWQHYRYRRALFGEAVTAFQPLPARLDGERILVRGEQGLGDVLFFLRFAPLVRARGAWLTLECEGKLHPLIVTGDVPQAVTADATGTQFDRAVWAGELPALLESGDTPPAWRLAVSEAARNAARQRLAALGPAPYLGVTWRAGTDTARGREFGVERTSLTKSVPPRALGAALRGWSGTVIALQRGARREDAAEFAAGYGAPFHDLSALGDDLPALLAVLAELDDYVTVSNTNVHLLAGLGKTARVAIPFPAEWRWMRREGRSPWFPDFAVYRQPRARDWSAPLGALRADLGL